MTFSQAALEANLRTRFTGRRVVSFPSVVSTMDAARAEAAAGACEGTLVIAEEQTRGRGRLGRQWLSPPGSNIYASLLLRPVAAEGVALSMIAPLAVCEAIEAVCGLACAIKWPNDVLISGRKVSGLLIEVEFAAGRIDYALVGAGINVNFDPSPFAEIRDTATSLARELGQEVSREEVLAALLNRFEGLYLAERDGRSAYPAWKARLTTLGQRVQVRLPDRSEEGLAEDVDREGRLLLRRADGSVIAVSAGDVVLRA